jgi:uncharacterized protein (TIGR00369 family)
MSEGVDWGEPRSRTVRWWDPAIGARAMRDLSGREYLQAMADGVLPAPPVSDLMRMRLTGIGDGSVEFRCRPDESAYNPIGLVHGGLVCTLLDSVAGCAVQTTLPAGVGYTSLEIKVSYLRPVRLGDGELVATGRVTKPGRRAAFADGEVRDERGRLVATASSTCLVFPLTDV